MIERWRNPCGDGEPLQFSHLGGTATNGDPSAWYPQLWDYLVKLTAAKRMLDVGCGVGFTQKYFHDIGVDTEGIDCEEMRPYHKLPDKLVAYDLTLGKIYFPRRYDIIWCCEVGEHIAEQFVDNLIHCLTEHCKQVLAFCAALPGAGGYHHVNCKPTPYWIKKLSVGGLTYDEASSAHCRSLCPPDTYFYRSGLIFIKD